MILLALLIDNLYNNFVIWLCFKLLTDFVLLIYILNCDFLFNLDQKILLKF